MENIKGKINRFSRLYFSYMFLACSGATTYILIVLAFNYSSVRLILLGILIIFILLGYIYKYNRGKKANNFIGLILLKISRILYTTKIQKLVFEQIVADWQEEYFEALFKKEIWKARWINVRYTYAFLVAMWQKSPIGDLIEFVIKIAKP